MGKQGKGQKRSKPAGRPAPYAKKPVVEVRYEGAPAASSRPVAAANGKGKGRAASPPVDTAAAAPSAASASASTSAAASAPLPANFKIIVGTYEKLLYGLEGTYTPGSPVPALAPVFIFPAHLACVKAVAASPGGGKWLATGSEDEFVKVWDLRRRKEVGSLSQHTGSITSLTFPTPSHLLTSSDDATLSLFRTSDWALLKSLKGHAGRVNHVDVHPTGRVALSVGKDRTLKMWDLMRGRGAASLPLGAEADAVRFSGTGRWFAVLFRGRVEVYSLTLKLLYTLDAKTQFNAVLFAQMPAEDGDGRELLCVGTDKGVVEVYDFSYDEDDDAEDDDDEEEDDEAEGRAPRAAVERVATLVGHTNRIKAMSSLRIAPPGAAPTVLLTTVSSDGLINLHDLARVPAAGPADIEPIAAYDTKGSRLTCVFLAEGGVRGPAARAKAAKQEGGQAGRARFDAAAGGMGSDGDEAEEDEDEEDEEDEEDDEDVREDMYELGSDEDEDEDGGMEVEVEGEDEDEDEEEGEYE